METVNAYSIPTIITPWEKYKMVEVKFVKLPHGEDLPSPQYETEGSAGFDLRAAFLPEDYGDFSIAPGERALVPTGLIMAIPKGYEGQVRPRSGLAIKYGITVLNSPGTIDSDYRGEIKVILINLGKEPVLIERGERIAQLVISSVQKVNLEYISISQDETERGDGGFGSTGVK